MITLDRRELDFQLFDVAAVEDLCSGPFADYERTVISGIMDTAEDLAREKFLPHAEKSDRCEPRFEDGRAILIPEIGEALAAFRDAGLFGSTFDHEWGGLQMPETLRSALSYLFFTANIGTSGYVLLTNGAANVLAAFASQDQKSRFLRPMVEGRFFGTMCLSEPHAGSSLADIGTMAHPQDDGSYHLRGRKMWISGGEQDISENIVHLVLAKVPGGGEGVRGISLFIAPKYHVDEDGGRGERNGIQLAGLNHKMGYRGTTNTVLNFGEERPCVAFRVGEEGHGLFYMFHMMNEARIAVGLGATALAAAGYSVALQYARERKQGRSPDAKDPGLPPVPIIEHGDVRRLLLAQKVAVEGSLALLLYTAGLIDKARLSEDS
ncbi:MAG: acyl-CoA dehydrogenase family protein, partial [Pseudomonadota bacterium]